MISDTFLILVDNSLSQLFHVLLLINCICSAFMVISTEHFCDI